MSGWDDPQNMVAAIGPGGTVVDIRHPGQYERWHGQKARDGLRCLDCDQPVNPRRLPARAGTPRRDILVHSPRPDGVDQEEKCREVRTSRRGRGWRRALAEAVAERCRQLGYEAEVEPELSDTRVDVVVRGRHTFALLRIELDKIDFEDARKQHNVLQRLRDDRGRKARVLWLTYNCSWVAQELPALAIRFKPERPKLPAVDVAGLWCVVDAGILTPDKLDMLRQPEQAEFGLAYVLQQFLENTMHHNTIGGSPMMFGWASPKRWVKMLQSLRAANTALRSAVRSQTTRADAAEEALRQAQQNLEQLRLRLQQVTHERDQAAQDSLALTVQLRAANEWADEVDLLRRGAVGRWLLRKVPSRRAPGKS